MDFDHIPTRPPKKRPQLPSLLLMMVPFLLAAACIGMGALAFGWLGERAVASLLQSRAGAVPEQLGIPVTGGEVPPSQDERPPQSQALPESEYPGYLILAQERMASCYDSFGAFVELEQLVFEEPALFQDESYRVSAQEALDLFRYECQSLRTLPEAPPAYQELDHWLRQSADEAGLAADNFSQALEAGQSGVFASRFMNLTVEHLLNFIDYTHNAASVLEELSDRRDL